MERLQDQAHPVRCFCAVCFSADNHSAFVREYLRSVFSPSLSISFDLVETSQGFVAHLIFSNTAFASLTVCETFPDRASAERWISTGVEAADNVSLSGGPCNTATLSPAGESSC